MMGAIFLDRDGVINENRHDYVKSWDEFQFIPGALKALRRIRSFGIRTFVVTNQAIVNRGGLPTHVIEDIHDRMIWQVSRHGGHIDDVMYCPHDASEECPCRKPRPGMLKQLAAKWNIELERSYFVGDAWTDVAAGRAVGCCCIMVRTGRGADQMALPESRKYPAHHIAADLDEAIEWILLQDRLRHTLRADVPPSEHQALAVGL